MAQQLAGRPVRMCTEALKLLYKYLLNKKKKKKKKKKVNRSALSTVHHYIANIIHQRCANQTPLSSQIL